MTERGKKRKEKTSTKKDGKNIKMISRKKEKQNAQNYQSHKDKYNDKQKERVECPHCKKELAKGFLTEHIQTQHS